MTSPVTIDVTVSNLTSSTVPSLSPVRISTTSLSFNSDRLQTIKIPPASFIIKAMPGGMDIIYSSSSSSSFFFFPAKNADTRAITTAAQAPMIIYFAGKVSPVAGTAASKLIIKIPPIKNNLSRTFYHTLLRLSIRVRLKTEVTLTVSYLFEVFECLFAALRVGNILYLAVYESFADLACLRRSVVL